MSGPLTAPARSDVSDVVCAVHATGADVRIRVDGCVGSSADVEQLRTVLRAAFLQGPERIIVDLNHVDGLGAPVIEAIVALRGEATTTVVAIDISRLHGPPLLALLARLLDPGERPTISRPRPTWP
jgi:hypothetical protein